MLKLKATGKCEVSPSVEGHRGDMELRGNFPENSRVLNVKYIYQNQIETHMKLWFQPKGITVTNEPDKPSGQGAGNVKRESIIHHPWVKPAVAIFCALEIIDGMVTYWAVNRGLISEGNHLIAQMAGSWNFVVLKVIGAILSGFILLKLSEHFPKITTAAAVSIAVLYGGVLVWNSSIIIHVLVAR
jgi:Domain of unknown function (DUF5658)